MIFKLRLQYKKLQKPWSSGNSRKSNTDLW